MRPLKILGTLPKPSPQATHRKEPSGQRGTKGDKVGKDAKMEEYEQCVLPDVNPVLPAAIRIQMVTKHHQAPIWGQLKLLLAQISYPSTRQSCQSHYIQMFHLCTSEPRWRKKSSQKASVPEKAPLENTGKGTLQRSN